MPNLIRIIGKDKLHELRVSFEHVDSQGCTLVLLIATVDSFKVLPLLEVQQFQSDTYEI